MHARSGAFALSAGGVDRAVQTFRSEQLPQYQKMSGYKGFTMLANRRSGQVLWRSPDPPGARAP